MNKILHISDWHGDMQLISNFKDLDYDIVVCSGDLMPNNYRGNVEKNIPFQTNWIKNNISSFKKMIKDCPFIFSSGNHDFIDPCEILNDNNINAVNIDFKKVDILGLSFYGFPAIPYIAGEWNFETTQDKMIILCNQLEKEFPVDVLVAHSPLGGILDRDGPFGDQLGNCVLTNYLFYKDMKLPKAILSGHVHGGFGSIKIENCMFFNSACSYQGLQL